MFKNNDKYYKIQIRYFKINLNLSLGKQWLKKYRDNEEIIIKINGQGNYYFKCKYADLTISVETDSCDPGNFMITISPNDGLQASFYIEPIPTILGDLDALTRIG